MKRGEIWTVAGGKDCAGKPRPVVIVQQDSFDATDSITVCAFTTDETDAPLFRPPMQPNERNRLRATSRLMLDKLPLCQGPRLARASAGWTMRIFRGSTRPFSCSLDWRSRQGPSRRREQSHAPKRYPRLELPFHLLPAYVILPKCPRHQDTLREGVRRAAARSLCRARSDGRENITAHLNQHRIFTRDGGRWGIGRVHRILTHAANVGRHEFNKRSKSGN